MSRSKRSTPVRASRRYTRSRFDSLLARGRAGAADLASCAGLADAALAGQVLNDAQPNRLSVTDRATIEQLERRQMLFSLAVTSDDVDPATGLGTVRANFGYILPYLATDYQVPTDTTPTDVSENFSEIPFGALGSGTFIIESGLRFRHNIAPGDNFRIFGIPPAADNQERWLRTDFSNTSEFFEFSFFGDDNAPPNAPIGVRTASFDLRPATELADPRGLDTNNVRMSLLFNGQVIANFTGAALRALILPEGPLNSERGIGRMTVVAPDAVGAFDTIRFSATNTAGNANPAFELDNITYSVPQPRFAELLDDLDFGATAVLTGPVGASVTFFDLNGTALRRTISLGIPTGGTLALVDLDDDGRPNFNVGIGSIVFSGSDSRTSFTLWGGTLEAADEAPIDADEFDGLFAFSIADGDTNGLYDDFEDAGFGYAWVVNNGALDVAGLPPGPGSVVVGSPFVRAISGNPLAAAGPNTITAGYARTDQGIFVRNGQSIGTINIHGILHGASVFSGFVDNIYVGLLPGSISVEGDLGSLVVGSDAGLVYPDPAVFTNAQIIKTNGQLFVGRTLGEVAVGGRSLLDITVLGDLNSPTTRPARDVFTYYEREFVFGIDTTATPDTVINALLNNQQQTIPNSQIFRTAGSAALFGNSFFRNDGLLNAEFISSSSTGVRIKGDLSALDPLNGEDKADVYAFVADGTQDIILDGFTVGAPLYFRIIDQAGRTLATPSRDADARGVRDIGTTQVRWRPDGPGLFYIVISDPNGNDADTDVGPVPYTLVVSGMATVTFGSLTTGAGAGFEGRSYSINVLNGDVGALRIGVGVTGPDGDATSPLSAFNPIATADTEDDAHSFRGGTFSTPGSLYNISTGGDLGVPGGGGQQFINIFIGRDLGTIFTGLLPGFGQVPTQGDLNNLNLTVGGRIAGIFISGGVGMDQDNDDPFSSVGLNRFVLHSGEAGGPGDIGIIRLGGHIATDSFRINTSPGSTIGALLISQDDYRVIGAGPPGGDFGIYARGIGGQGLPIVTGAGSDVRFVDVPRQDLFNSPNVLLPLIGGQTLQLVDDGGSQVRISIENGLPGAIVGFVRTLAIDGSQGVAISQIQADLTGGATLRIQGTNPLGRGVVGIGRILIVGGDAGSRVQIDGTVEIDIFRIDAIVPIDEFVNQTVGGDLVTGIFAGLGRIEIQGDLGRTQWPAWSNKKYAEAIAFAAAGVPLANSDEDNGLVYRPVNDDNFDLGNAYLDDIGAPYDIFLNGIFIGGAGPIGGNGLFEVTEVKATGSIGDVLSLASIETIIADSDGVAPLNGFDGLIGSIFATDLGNVDIGMGFAPATASPFAEVGIFATDDIERVFSTRANGVIIRGPIIARNDNVADNALVGNIDGISTIELNNGLVIDSYIASERLDTFWRSLNYADISNQFGSIQRITLNNTNLFRSTIAALRVEEIIIEGGFYDASRVFSTGFIGNVRATGFRNSTLGADPLQERESVITSGGDLRSITAVADISDLIIDVVGNLVEGVTAVNATRVQFQVDNTIESVVLSGDLRASTFTVGRVPTISVAGNIVSSTIASSGPIQSVVARNFINSTLDVTGPDGELRSLTTTGNITGSISSSGPIGTISAGGDIRGRITTFSSRGTVELISAIGDLDITGDFAAGVNQFLAGRNIGSKNAPGVILVRGNLAQATATNGQLYSDLRVGGSILGAITIGSVANKIGQADAGAGSIIAFGRIASVIVGGDFGGDIISYSGGIASVAINNGSFLTGRTISAFDGSIGALTITNGNLYGSVFADYNITSLRVVAGADGVFGDIGVNPAFSQGVNFDARRNQVPPGIFARPGIQGPSIFAGLNIVSIAVTNGSVFETTIGAGRVIQLINITGSVGNDSLTTAQGSVFYAGDLIDRVTITGSVDRAGFYAGLTNLGLDNRPGGTGTSTDTVKSGSINVLTIGGALSNATFSAGVNAGNGIYNDGIGETVATGLSNVNTIAVNGSVTNASIYADSISSPLANDNRFTRVTNIVNSDSQIANAATPPGGISFTGNRILDTNNFTLSGPGSALYYSSLGRLVLLNTTAASTLTVASINGQINNLTIVSIDDSSLGTLTLQSALAGNSNIIIDGGVANLNFQSVNITGRITIGGDTTSAVFTSFTGGTFTGRSVGSIRINGDYGTTATNEAAINVLNTGAVNISGVARALINSERDIGAITLTGGTERALIRSGGTIASLTSGAFRQTVLSARDNLGSVTINGDMFDSAILVGADLGSDGFFGGVGTAADRNTTGFLGAVTVNGNFRESDIAAGFLRGADGFFGTTDDTVAPGRSSVASVTISGTQVGSVRFSESYRIASSGTLGPVTVGGQPFNGTSGNFGTTTPNLAPASIQVNNFTANIIGRTYIANLTFNQPIDASSISSALSVLEVRGSGDIEIRLIEGIDFTTTYLPGTNQLQISLATAVTERNLPQIPGIPGPGIYRVVLNQNALRATLGGVKIDGDGNGFAEAADSFAGSLFLGDAGDKLTAVTVDADPGPGNRRVDFYGPVNLNIVFDNSRSPDGLADTNRTFTINGVIGDNPDHDSAFYRTAGDTDLYSITLQAGQILQLGRIRGAAENANLSFFGPNGQPIGAFANTAAASALPAPVGEDTDSTQASAFLIKQTGTYIIGVFNGLASFQNNTVPNLDPVAGGIGAYSFTIQVFDDGDSGFTSNSSAGDGTVLAEAPAPINFAGVDGIFGNGDDISEVFLAGFRFTLNRGADGVANTADDIVTGNNGLGAVSTRINNVVTTNVESSIGPRGFAGVPGLISSDVDVFHLNNRQPIAAGNRYRVTLKLTDSGADLGATASLGGQRGSVQFGLFDTSASTGVSDATLVFSPSAFTGVGGQTPRVLADSGQTKYGYDSKGDFFIEFTVPDRLDAPGQNGTFALYVQGIFNTDYNVEIVTLGTGALAPVTQNVLIETGGGLLDWLQPGGITTQVNPFTARSLGFTGSFNGVSADQYILSQVITSLNAVFQGAGIDVRFSTSSADFEFQPFSTVYLTNTPDPLTPLFDVLTGFAGAIPGGATNNFISGNPFGYSEGSDPFNANLEDEAVVFVQPFALSGYAPSQTDADRFAQGLEGAVARRVGELLGLRITSNNAPGNAIFDPFASDAVSNVPGAGRAYSLLNGSRQLSDNVDSVPRTNFFLGNQNSLSLLDRIIGRI